MFRRPLPVLMLAAVAMCVGSVAVNSSVVPLSIDQGAAGAWQKILKLQTVASIMHTTAHPDDEQGELLAALGRGRGVRTAMLTLNRGEAGDNAIGPELFDALGLIRTDELAQAAEYYGLDEQYFTRAVDFGFSKRADEALTKWDRAATVEDMVRAIRTSRPLVVVSRWQGTERDGHGQHQAAGLLTPEAVAAAADTHAFPTLAKEGLRPWRVLKVFSGGWRESDAWQVAIDSGTYDAALGDSYANLGKYGLSLQRSQTAGRFVRGAGPAVLYYARVDAPGPRESDLFEGLDTSIPAAYRLLGRRPPEDGEARLAAIAVEVAAAKEAFRWTDPAASAPALARGLTAARAALAATVDDDVAFLLRVKERQFQDALAATMGLELTATAEPAGTRPASGPYAAFAPPATLNAVTAGQRIDVSVSLVKRSSMAMLVDAVRLGGAAGLDKAMPIAPTTALDNRPLAARLTMTIPAAAPVTRPYFTRHSIADTRYDLLPGAIFGAPWGEPALTLTARYRVDGASATLTVPVVRREAVLPDGYALHELDVVPPASVSLTPGVLIVPADGSKHAVEVNVDVVSHSAKATPPGVIRLETPSGWVVTPSTQAIALGAPGERRQTRFTVAVPTDASGVQTISAALFLDGHKWGLSYQPIRHRDLPVRYLVREATAVVSVFGIARGPKARVGYVMGIGDEMPAALAQLGTDVTLLSPDDLASGNFSRFDAIITGTRAYAVRDDLRTHNRRLLDWVQGGGNLIVLYNTPEFDPRRFAPYEAELPQDAEEVSEEDAPVTLLAPDNALLSSPNRIDAKDFDGWIEQRGSKFFARWDPRYTALVESHDLGQAPQRGGWLTSGYGKGRWTYMAYALHRQVPYGVPGAYRILANLIASAHGTAALQHGGTAAPQPR
jgi:LmbE family N-acetylglucosaminyl deacetylase